MTAVRKSEAVVTIEGFLNANPRVEIRMKGKKPKAGAKKTMTLKEIRTLLGKPDPKDPTKRKPMPLEEFADAIGSKRSTVWFWENGTRTMPPKFQARVQALLISLNKEEGNNHEVNGSAPSGGGGGFPKGDDTE